MRQIEVSLVEFLEGAEGGIRLLGRTNDPDAVAYVRDRLARERRTELARLEQPVRLVPAEPPPSEDEDR